HAMNTIRWFGLLMLMVFSVPPIKAQITASDAVITLERSACFGACPVYTVNILEDGTVTYEGQRHVSVIGKQTGEIPPETVALMVAAFEDAGYFNWNDAYTMQGV